MRMFLQSLQKRSANGLASASLWARRVALTLFIFGVCAVICVVVVTPPLTVYATRPSELKTVEQIRYAVQFYRLVNESALWVVGAFVALALYAYTTSDWKVGRIAISASLTLVTAVIGHALLAQDLGFALISERADLPKDLLLDIKMLKAGVASQSFWAVILLLGLSVNLLASALAMSPGSWSPSRRERNIDDC